MYYIEASKSCWSLPLLRKCDVSSYRKCIEWTIEEQQIQNKDSKISMLECVFEDDTKISQTYQLSLCSKPISTSSRLGNLHNIAEKLALLIPSLSSKKAKQGPTNPIPFFVYEIKIKRKGWTVAK